MALFFLSCLCNSASLLCHRHTYFAYSQNLSFLPVSLLKLLPQASICPRAIHMQTFPHVPEWQMGSSKGETLGQLRYLPSWYYLFMEQNIGESNGNPLQYSCLENPMDGGAWQAAVHGVANSQTRLSDFTFTFHFHALEKEMATHSSVLPWRIPGTAEPGGLPSMGSHRVGHD